MMFATQDSKTNDGLGTREKQTPKTGSWYVVHGTHGTGQAAVGEKNAQAPSSAVQQAYREAPARRQLRRVINVALKIELRIFSPSGAA